jgi:uncharacterized membrane protein YciS (DUF1049 family)
METVKRLLVRFWPTGALFLVGFILIIYVALGILYLQQRAQQGGFEEQISKLSLIVAKPLPSVEELQAEYDEANISLAPMTNQAVLDILVGIASDSGIDIDPDNHKFYIPPGKVETERVGEGNYQVLSFTNINAQGDYDSVMDLISDLDSGATLKTMVLKRVSIQQVEDETAASLDVDIYTLLEEGTV